MSIPAIGGFDPVSGVTGVSGPGTAMTNAAGALERSVGAGETGATVGADFAGVMARGVEQLQGLQDQKDGLAVQAASGELTDVHDYMIAATQAQVATEVTVAIRNKAVEAFQTIMRMQL